MRSVQIREAESELSALIEAAERGEPTTITKHGQAAAVLVPVDVARKLYPPEPRDFGTFLLSLPGSIDFDRPAAGLRDVDL